VRTKRAGGHIKHANTEASQAAGLFSHAWRYQIRLVDELFTSKLVRIFSYANVFTKPIPNYSEFRRVIPEDYRHKKARRACAVRALRTSSDDSGNHRWRILVELAGVEPASEIPTSSVLHA
jgi:hypothetical protein